jgi:hypothetical protein
MFDNDAARENVNDDNDDDDGDPPGPVANGGVVPRGGGGFPPARVVQWVDLEQAVQSLQQIDHSSLETIRS